MAIVICDVDGCVADFVPFLVKKMQEILPDEKLPKTEDITEYNLFKFFKKGKQLNALHTLMSKKSFWTDLPVIEGAKEAVKAIQDAGHTVLFVTKPWYPCEAWLSARFGYLEEHFGVTEANVLFGAAKQYVDGDIIIDDCPEYIMNWGARYPNRKAFVFDNAYNKEFRMKNCTRIFSWKKGLDKILKAC